MRILVVDDEVSITKAIKAMLEHNKYTVDTVHNGTDALQYISGAQYDAVILDIMMPGMSGIEVLERIRNRGNTTPVLFLSAKGEVEDRVRGLNAGADDYLVKPFAYSELLARVKALTRRSHYYSSERLKFGKTILDCGTFELISGEQTTHLNNKEFQLMELFFKNPHQIFSAEHLMENIWEMNTESGMDVVWTHIGFLRKKLRELGADVEIITMRGVGYSLREKITIYS
ncbi:MAG: response regulator transcription factor [Eubacteriales bacterium]|nr:response regulator transcription factor [Eubacteriales bacterium]